MTLIATIGLRKRVEQNRTRLYRMAYAWCYDPATADDLVQECLTRALQNLGKLRDSERLEVWLYSILNNCWREHLRRRRPNEEFDEEQFVCENCPETQSYQQEIVQRVRDAIACLPMGQRKVVTLVDLEGFSYAEVAGILEIPIGTVMSRLSRARTELQRRLADLAEHGESAPRLRRVK
ncbi:MAG: sigma-70 family RNA polymerase sigma factor [Gammaproteobacteria bacterium]|nr:sigma-70 family RNA polymerase sigma factor [Gammaproteobacteria bacterium]